jgi:hypothetical protein
MRKWRTFASSGQVRERDTTAWPAMSSFVLLLTAALFIRITPGECQPAQGSTSEYEPEYGWVFKPQIADPRVPLISNKIRDFNCSYDKPYIMNPIRIGSDGRLYRGSNPLHLGSALESRSGVDFILTVNGELVLGSRHQYLAVQAGCPDGVRLAGKIMVKNGWVTNLYPNDTGHFKGTVEESLEGLRHLQKMGIDLSKAGVIWTYPLPGTDHGFHGKRVMASSILTDTSTPPRPSDCSTVGFSPKPELRVELETGIRSLEPEFSASMTTNGRLPGVRAAPSIPNVPQSLFNPPRLNYDPKPSLLSYSLSQGAIASTETLPSIIPREVIVSHPPGSMKARLEALRKFGERQYTPRAQGGVAVGGTLLAATHGLTYYADALDGGATLNEAAADGLVVTGLDSAGIPFAALGPGGWLAGIPFASVADLASTLQHNGKFKDMEYISGELSQAGYDFGSGMSYDRKSGLLYHKVGGRYEPYTTRSSGLFSWYGDWWNGVEYYYFWDPVNRKVTQVRADPRGNEPQGEF